LPIRTAHESMVLDLLDTYLCTYSSGFHIYINTDER